MLEERPYFNGKEKVKEGVRETGFPGGSDGKGSACNAEDLGLIPGLGRSPGGGHSNPVFLPGESHEQRSLTGQIHRVTKSWPQLK